MTNVTFENNTAVRYGQNIASYPVKLALTSGESTSNIQLKNVASGQEYPEYLSFRVVDYENQLIETKIVGSVYVNPIEANTSIEGVTSFGMTAGYAKFNGITFVAPPGSQNVKFRISSSVIDTRKLLKVFGKFAFIKKIYRSDNDSGSDLCIV
jgi:type 1 glutamine amidotransferase